MFLCKFVEKNLKPYANNEVGLFTTFLVREHISSCSSCCKKLESISGKKVEVTVNLKAVKEQVAAQEDAATARSRAEANEMRTKPQK